MSLRTRLIIAFLLFSIVPLTVVTFFSYASSVHAVENAAHREATDDAADIGRRMEIITVDVGRRMDRIFDPAMPGPNALGTTGEMRQRIAPALGDTAALVERLEFHPAEADPKPRPIPDAAPALAGAPPKPPLPPAPLGSEAPKAPATAAIVVDVPRIMAEARQAVREHQAASPDAAPLVDQGLAIGLTAAESSMKAVAEALASSQPAMTAALQDMQMEVDGRRIEIAVKKAGKVVGKTSSCPTSGWRCSWATCRAKASARPCSWPTCRRRFRQGFRSKTIWRRSRRCWTARSTRPPRAPST